MLANAVSPDLEYGNTYPANTSSTFMTTSMTSIGTATNLGSFSRMSNNMVPCSSADIAFPGPPMGRTLFCNSGDRMHSAMYFARSRSEIGLHDASWYDKKENVSRRVGECGCTS